MPRYTVKTKRADLSKELRDENKEHIMKHHESHGIRYFASNLSIAIGLVLIWRGIWYILDAFDYHFLDGNHLPMAIIGIGLGLLILYIPDKDLKELQKL